MTDIDADATPRRRRFRKRWVLWAVIAAWSGIGLWQTVKPMPPGTAVATAPMPADDVQFLYDLTHADPQGQVVYEQRIFDEAFRLIDEAETFVVADFFLLNEMMGRAGASYRPLSRQLADHLIERKKARPELTALLITDPINEVYGGMPSPLFAELRAAGIEVVVTDLDRLRDSNPAYSALWRTFAQWWGNSAEGGSMSNPFATDAPPITLRSWLALLNFKANHRKLIVADRPDGKYAALVASANPHDASSAHSNVALRFSGDLAEEILGSEMAVARFSGWRGHIYSPPSNADAPAEAASTRLAFLTEEAIRDHLLRELGTTRNADTVRIAMFYLSDRKIVLALLEAARRGVNVRIILDPNRDAFGRQKDGVPNRPVANELVTSSGERIQVRWFRTNGEQFHTKLVLISRGEELIASLGSANFTRRNVGNYNLEANVAVWTPAGSPLALEMTGYYDRLWNNDGPSGTEFTAPFGAYREIGRASCRERV